MTTCSTSMGSHTPTHHQPLASSGTSWGDGSPLQPPGLRSCSGRAPHPAAEAAACESASCWAPHRGELAGGWQEQAEAGIPPGHQTTSQFPLPRVWHTAGGRQAEVALLWAVSICQARCPAACEGTAVTPWPRVTPPWWLLRVVLAQMCIITVAALLLHQGIPPCQKPRRGFSKVGETTEKQQPKINLVPLREGDTEQGTRCPCSPGLLPALLSQSFEK